MKQKDRIVKLCSPRELVEYTLLRDALEKAGIECLDRPHVDSAYDDLYVPAKGYADLFVYEADLEDAEKIIEALKKDEGGDQERE